MDLTSIKLKENEILLMYNTLEGKLVTKIQDKEDPLPTNVNGIVVSF